ncbi:MAG: hypothetical protein PVF96_04080 [Candidatus Bathyarchaeota archaeon]
MRETALVTAFYISLAWTLMISYQFFTQTAVETVTSSITNTWPSLGSWLASRMDMIVFIHAFAWVFLLASAIPSIILGKNKGVLPQFAVCLALTFSAFILQDILIAYGGGTFNSILSLASLFYSPLFAIGYLAMPYLLMFSFDIYSKQKEDEEIIENNMDESLDDGDQEEVVQMNEWVEEQEKLQEEECTY